MPNGVTITDPITSLLGSITSLLGSTSASSSRAAGPGVVCAQSWMTDRFEVQNFELQMQIILLLLPIETSFFQDDASLLFQLSAVLSRPFPTRLYCSQG